MTLMPLDTLGVTSTDGVANVLATILAVSTTPATAVAGVVGGTSRSFPTAA